MTSKRSRKEMDEETYTGGGGGRLKAVDCREAVEWHTVLCRLFKRFVFYSARFPVFRSEFIRDYVDKPTTAPEELREYVKSSTQTGTGLILLLIALYAVYFLKNCYFIFTAFFEFDHSKPEEEVKLVANEENLRSFACLRTNCSLIRQNSSLGVDLSYLPIFQICHPKLDAWYTPATKLDGFGILAFALSSFGVLILGSMVPVKQFFLAAANDVIMFLVAPNVTMQMAQANLCKLRRDFLLSYENFCELIVYQKHRLRIQPLRLSLINDNEKKTSNLISSAQLSPQLSTLSRYKEQTRDVPQPQTTFRVQHATGSGTFKRTSILRRMPPPVLQLQQRDELPSESFSGKRGRSTSPYYYLPAIQTKWGSNLLSRKILVFSLGPLISITCVGSFALVYIEISVLAKLELLRKFANKTRELNCAIWTKENELLDLERLDLSWTTYAALETTIINFMCGYTIAMLLTYWTLVVCHLMIWLAEIRTLLIESVTFVRFQIVAKQMDATRIGAAKRLYDLRKLRKDFKKRICLDWIFPLSIITWFEPNSSGKQEEEHRQVALLSSTTCDKLREKLFLAELLAGKSLTVCYNQQEFDERTRRQTRDKEDETTSSSDDCLLSQDGETAERQEDENDLQLSETNLETLEKTYIECRMLNDYVHKCSTIVAILLSVVYTLNYGLVLVATICERKIKSLESEPIIVIAFGWLIANALIFTAARFHASVSGAAQRKHLQPIGPN